MLTNHTFVLTTPSWNIKLPDRYYQINMGLSTKFVVSGFCHQLMPTNCSAAKQLSQFCKHSKSADLLRKSLLSHVWRVPSSKALSCKHERLFDLLTLASSSYYGFYRSGANKRRTDWKNRVRRLRFSQSSHRISRHCPKIESASSLICSTASDRYSQTPHSKCR